MNSTIVLIVVGCLLAGAAAAAARLIHHLRQHPNPEVDAFVWSRNRRRSIAGCSLILCLTLGAGLPVLVFSPYSPLYLGENLGGWIAIAILVASFVGCSVSWAAMKRYPRLLAEEASH